MRRVISTIVLCATCLTLSCSQQPEKPSPSTDAAADAAPDEGRGDAGTPEDTGPATDTGTPDTGTPDTGTPDTGTPDTGTPDTGTPDTGTPDTGTPDTGTSDTGTPDTGTPDTGTPDTGTPDTGTPDTGTPDTGTPDAGTPDTGTPDTGTPDAGCPDADGDGFEDASCGGTDCDDALAAVNPGATEVCDNTLDDDCDGLADDLDPDCTPSAEICDNGVDDDGDSDADCADDDCAMAAACEGNACPNPIIIASSKVTWVVDPLAFTDTATGSCGAQSGPEAVFTFNLASDSDVHIDTEDSTDDTLLYIREADCATGPELFCDDDVTDHQAWSRLDLHALPSGDYFVFADVNGTPTGDLTVNFSITDIAPRSPVPVDTDPLLRMPGTQPNSSTSLEGPDRCMNCHQEKNGTPLLGQQWKGSMMAQAARDPLFWSAMTVAAQDSVWVLGNPNATDLCERCHFPEGWLEERSDPTNASLMTDSDFDGVHCDVCHQLVDPFATATAAGTREGSDWTGYWDEQDAVDPSSSTRAATTLAQDQSIFAGIDLFDGDPFYDSATWLPALQDYVENGSGQMFVANGGAKRGPYADDTANHQTFYSRYHKSKYFCSTCHDVSNPALANLGAPTTQPLPSESSPAYSYFHVERTFSEFMLSTYAQQGGAAGTGPFAPANFDTRHQGDVIASCQDCHMPQSVGVAVDKNSAKTRPTDSTEHLRHGVGSHAMVGGNAWIPRILASTVNGSPNYDATNDSLLSQGPAALTLDFSQGLPLDADALLAVADEAEANLRRAATIENVSYTSSSGALTFRLVNHTGHKLISGFPEGRRMWVNIVARDGSGNVIEEINPYDTTIGTLRGLDPDHAPSSPPVGADERHLDDLVYQMQPSSTLTGEDQTFHFVLADGRHKDNRIPPRGFDIAAAPERLSEPVIDGQAAPNHFTAAEYAGGYDEVSLDLVSGAASVEIRLYYQTTSREYMEFLRDQINGDATTLYSETPAGAAIAYVVQTDPFFSSLAAWGDTMWQLWEHNKDLPGGAPIEMATATAP